MPNRTLAWGCALASPLALLPLGRLLPLPNYLGAAQGLILLQLAAICTVTDLFRRRIPNWATYSAVLWAFVLASVHTFGQGQAERSAASTLEWGAPLVDWVDYSQIGIFQSGLGASLCFVVMAGIYCWARSGAGDVKMATAIGALVGPRLGLFVLAGAYILAATTMGSLIILRHGVWALLPAQVRAAMPWTVPDAEAGSTPISPDVLQQGVPLGPFLGFVSVAVAAGSPGAAYL